LHKKLLIEETFQRRGRAAGHLEDKYWHGDQEIVHAVWTLVHMCGSDDASGVRELVSDFISRVWQSKGINMCFMLSSSFALYFICSSSLFLFVYIAQRVKPVL
jgi:ataxia telangiectasia mutated family protein